MSPSNTVQSKAPGGSTNSSPKPAAVSLPRTPPVTTKAVPSGVDPAPRDWVKFGSRLRNQLPESDDEYVDDDDDASPKKRVDRCPGLAPERDQQFDRDHGREDTPADPVNDRRPFINHDRLDKAGEPLNPGNAPHDRWDTISVHTAKCDGCGNHNNKVVQRCKRCNLQYCQPCLRTRNDGLHFANVDLLDWTPKPMVRSKRTNEETRKRKAAPKAAAKNPKYVASCDDISDFADSLVPRQASRASTRAPTRPPSERVQLAEARRRNINPAGDEAIDPEFEEVPRRRRRQRDDDFELLDEAPRKRYYSEDEDMEMERMPKKSRGGRAVDREYDYEESSGEEVAEARARYTHDNRRPRDPYEDEMERPASRQSDVNNRARPMGYAPSTAARGGAREFLAPRTASRAGRATYMTPDEAIAAAWQQRQEMQRKSAREKRLQAASSNPIIQQLLAQGRDEEAEEVLTMAEALTDMSAGKK